MLESAAVPDLGRAWHSLEPDALQVWQFDSSCAMERRDWLVLNGDEQRRAAAFHDPGRRTDFVAGRATLRHVLARYCGVAPDEIDFQYGHNGKPALATAPGLAFNWSHSDGRWLLVVGMGGPVGIDIEVIDETLDWEALAKVALHPNEVAALRRKLPATGRRAFFQAWTLKEALLKATGEGLGDDLPRLCVIDENGDWRRLVEWRGAGPWHLAPLAVGRRHLAAIASQAPQKHLTFHSFPSHPAEVAGSR